LEFEAVMAVNTMKVVAIAMKRQNEQPRPPKLAVAAQVMEAMEKEEVSIMLEAINIMDIQAVEVAEALVDTTMALVEAANLRAQMNHITAAAAAGATTVEVTQEDITARKVVMEEVAKEDIMTPKVVMEEVTQEDITAQVVVMEKVAKEDTMAPKVVMEEAIQENITAREVGLEEEAATSHTPTRTTTVSITKNSSVQVA
jgi:hypothetical protein